MEAWINEQIVTRRKFVCDMQMNLEAKKEVARALEARARFCKAKVEQSQDDQVAFAIFTERYWVVMGALRKISEQSETLLVDYITNNAYLHIAEKHLHDLQSKLPVMADETGPVEAEAPSVDAAPTAETPVESVATQNESEDTV